MRCLDLQAPKAEKGHSVRLASCKPWHPIPGLSQARLAGRLEQLCLGARMALMFGMASRCETLNGFFPESLFARCPSEDAAVLCVPGEKGGGKANEGCKAKSTPLAAVPSPAMIEVCSWLESLPQPIQRDGIILLIRCAK
ncbi:unnamed protein product [Effrenium voratum]|uniref:Uncharacterized protein n=1 Tax=Effrenium voratum TaxID=2562239 RepID=A0AA36N2K7_9DINO|nr:unnamed protein product [Effrenium voratum]